jgi:hypothetical protein
VIVPHDAPGRTPPAPRPAIGEVVGQQHKLSLVSLVAKSLALPLDVEPYPPGDYEQAASVPVLTRTVPDLGRRFARYVVADGLYACATFLHAAGALGLRVFVRLKENVPTLLAAARARFAKQPPTQRFEDGGDHVDMWDADDFDPWDGLDWPTVCVLRDVQRHPDGTVVEVYWLARASFPSSRASCLLRLPSRRLAPLKPAARVLPAPVHCRAYSSFRKGCGVNPPGVDPPVAHRRCKHYHPPHRDVNAYSGQARCHTPWPSSRNAPGSQPLQYSDTVCQDVRTAVELRRSLCRALVADGRECPLYRGALVQARRHGTW